MYCPRCAEQNLDDAKFCRACGANVSLVPQALTGSLPPALAVDTEKRANGVKYTIISMGLLVVAVAVLLLAPPNDGWVFFFLTMVAACIMFGVAVGEFVSAGHGQHHTGNAGGETSELEAKEAPAELPPARETASMIPPASVAESTTRNLAPKVAARSGEGER
jgi:hypothetical protein